MRSSAFFLTTLLLCSSLPDTLKASHIMNPVVSNQIQQAISELNLYRQTQQKAGLQDPNLAYGMRKAVVIAELMIDANGKINSSLSPIIKSSFIPNVPLEYEANMGRILDHLNSSWQPFFDKIVKPSQANSTSTLILRSLFSLGVNDLITDRHAKVAVLASMLAPYNQGPVGDCFAVADLVRDHEEFPKHTALDIASVIETGFLTRAIGTASDNFFFLPILADSDRDKPFTIDTSGTIVGTGIAFLSTPGINAACKIMGADQIPNLSTQVTSLLFPGTRSSQIQVSAAQVIQAIAHVVSKQTPSLDIQALISNGEYAFSSLSSNPILKSIECAFAAMAEDRASDSTRGNINSCVMQALNASWTSFSNLPSAAEYQSAFATNFNDSYRLVYNPDIPLAQVSSDGSSTDGGFQLYKRDPVLSNMGTRMATPQDFRQLILDAISLTKNHIEGSDQIAAQLINVVQSDNFLTNALWAYDESNKQELNPIANYQKLARTPMQSCDGDNPYEVDTIDIGKNFDPNVETFTPSSSKDLITWCLNLAKKVPAELIPMDSPQHAFNFVPGNPDLASFVKVGKNPNDWIRQSLSIPGMKVSTRTIDTTTQSTLANAMYNMISNALPDSASYQSLVSSLSTSTMSVQKYSQSLLDGINNLLSSDSNQANQIGIALDGVLFQILPPQDRASLQQNAIRFAFTNWNDGTKDIYFCAYFNPRTEQVGFGTIDEDKTNLQPMDEQAWVNNQQWDVDLRPFAPANTSKSL